jgi:hypothetical protein
MRWLVIALVATAGCTQPPEDRAQIVCTTFCDCFAGTGVPALVESCVQDQCLPAIHAVSDACLACVYSHESTCSSLESVCETMCF